MHPTLRKTEGRLVNVDVPFVHKPVLLDAAIELLQVKPELTYVDVTAGAGGHLGRMQAIAGKRAQLVAIDRDPAAIAFLRANFSEKSLSIVHANFAHLKTALGGIGIDTVSGGILADLGVSSNQLDDPTRGFSFSKDGPLDMRMDTGQELTARDLINNLSERDLADIIFRFGEERNSRQIARRIVALRPLASTGQLAEIVASVYSKNGLIRRPRSGGIRRETIHPATRTFQAVRMAVNAELDCLKQFLDQASELLLPGARLVIITFHSLEDRMVKHFFRQKAANCLCPPRQPVCNCGHKPEFLIITPKPIVAEKNEVLANIRSRSAKLRAGEKLP